MTDITEGEVDAIDPGRVSSGSTDRPSVAEDSPARQKAVERSWDLSEEFASAKKNRKIAVILGVVMIAAGGATYFITGDWFYIVGFALIGGGIGLLASAPFTVKAAKQKFDEQNKLLALATSVSESLRDAGESPSMRDMIEINRKEMAGYHNLTMGQARQSFMHSQIAMYCGLGLVVFVIVVILFFDLPESVKITAASLAGISSLVSGYITKTFLKSHELSISQLNQFFGQPLVSSYLLTGERVAERLEGERRDLALMLVVEQALYAAAGAERDISDSPRARGGRTSRRPVHSVAKSERADAATAQG